MHRELAASLAHVADALADPMPQASQNILKATGRLRAGEAMQCTLFGDYYRLVEAVIEGNEAEILQLSQAIQAASPRHQGPVFMHCGQPKTQALCTQLNSDEFQLAPIGDDKAASFRALFNQGYDLLKSTLPDLHGDIAAIVHEVLLAQAPRNAAFEFDGASHYQFWGLLMLNPKYHTTPLAIVEVLAHEAGHSLLFGLTVEEPLVLNDDDALFASPLRVDPRPMDGIFHATFVSARMAWAMQEMARSSQLSDKQRGDALTAAQKDAENFYKGYDVIKQFGQLSATGGEIIGNAYEWMQANAPKAALS